MQNRIRVASMPINIQNKSQRPRSALLRGVQITEFKDNIINPDPIILQETDLLLEEFLSPTKLKALTGVNNLELVDHLEMIVDTSETSLGNFGIYLPRLKQLKLNGSNVPRIRDLGTSLAHLRVLWLSRSNLIDLDGIPTLNNLEEIYLSFNEIVDISPCSMLDNLKCLDLEGNLIEDLKQVEFLSLCSNLQTLTLYGNPICAKPSPDAPENDKSYNYRYEVIKILPHVKVLDDELTLNTSSIMANLRESNGPGAKPKITSHDDQCPFDDDWQLINEILDEGIGPPEEKLAINECLRPNSSSSRGTRTSSSVRPLSAMRPLSSYHQKNQAIRPKSRALATSSSNNAIRPISVAQNDVDPIGDVTNDASHLTIGPTLQGNPLKSLLVRKKQRDALTPDSIDTHRDNGHLNISSFERAPSPFITSSHKSSMQLIEESKNISTRIENKELRDEILKWKKEHAKKLEERKKYFEPQILKIEDDDDNPPSPISDIENDQIDVDYYDSATTRKSSSRDTSKPNRPHTAASSSMTKGSRLESMFKKTFNDESETTAANVRKKDLNVLEPIRRSHSKGRHISMELPDDVAPSTGGIRREQTPRRRSGSKDRARKSSVPKARPFEEDEQYSIIPSPPNTSMSFERRESGSNSSSRVATGDTGYGSVASESGSYSNLNQLMKPRATSNNRDGSSYIDRHQPKIVAISSLSPTSSLSNSASYMQPTHLKPLAQANLTAKSTTGSTTLATTSSLKQLKTNLMPLPGIKLPKN